jgi:2-oxoglutarate dehydrogenase E1 component
LRLEQLYPFPHKAFAAEIKKYPNLSEVVWCQDEPQNQGAWFFVQHYIHENMTESVRSSATQGARPRHPLPSATAHLHQEQQKALIEAGLRKLKGFVLTK